MAAHHENEDIQDNADGTEDTLDESVSEDSVLLRNLHGDDGLTYKLQMSNNTMNLLLRAHRDNVFPSCMSDLYDLLVITEHLKLEALKRTCLKHLFRHPEFFATYFPEELPDELVLTCFKESSKRLFRTKGIYMHELCEFLKFKRSDDFKEPLFRAFKSDVRKFGDLGLECVPLHFSERSVPVVIRIRGGAPQSTLCLNGDCFPFEMFGTNFDLYEANLDAFYLKYATYVLYKSGDAVYYKDLCNRIQAQKLLEECTLFMSKEDDVFAVTKVASGNQIWKWVESDQDGGSFVPCHRALGGISHLDFDTDTSLLLVLKESGSLSLRRLEERRLVLLRRYHGSFHSAWFHRGSIFTLSVGEEMADGCDWPRLKLCRKSLTDIKSCPEMEEYSEEISWDTWSDEDAKDESWSEEGAPDAELEAYKDEALQKFAANGRITYLGGVLFRISDNGLAMYGSLTSRTVLDRTRYVAVSDLSLYP